MGQKTTHRLRTERKGRAGFGGGLMEIEARRRKVRGNWVFIALCSSSRSGPPLGHVDDNMKPPKQQQCSFFNHPPEFSLIHLQTDDSPVNKAGGERWALSDPSEPVIQGAHVKTLLTVNEASCQTQTFTLTDGLSYSDPVCLTRCSCGSQDTKRNRPTCGAYSNK